VSAQHPYIPALDHKLVVRRAHLARVEKLAAASELEKQLEAEIVELQKRLEDHRRRRAVAELEVGTVRAEIAKLEKSRELALADERIANLLWMKLLHERQSESRSQK
jgi:hypothetical protein